MKGEMNYFRVEPYNSETYGIYGKWNVTNEDYCVVLRDKTEANMVCNMFNGAVKEMNDKLFLETFSHFSDLEWEYGGLDTDTDEDCMKQFGMAYKEAEKKAREISEKYYKED